MLMRDTVTSWLIWVAFVRADGTAIGRAYGEMEFGEIAFSRLEPVR